LKRYLALALALVLTFTLLPVSAMAYEIVDQGQCSPSLVWELDDAGTLDVEGTGTVTQSLGDLWDANLVRSVVLSEGVTGIDNYAYATRSTLYHISLPDSLTEIGSGAFRNCTSLTSITIPDGVSTIGDSAFAGCSALTEITLPSGLTEVPNSSFWYCTKLAQVTLPSGLTSIGTAAFGHTALTSISIPDSVTSIGGSAFMDCTNLTEVVIPNGVTAIHEYTFSDCTSLTSVVIPDSVTEIELSAFFGCSSLSSVVIPASVTEIGTHAFGYTKGTYGLTLLRNLTIYGYAGTAAQTYAKENHIPFIALDDDSASTTVDESYYLSEAVTTYQHNLNDGSDLDSDMDVDGPNTTSAYSAAAFSDVDSSEYYAEPVQWAVDNGITTGTSSTTFSPESACTRGQIVTFLWRANGSPTPVTTVNPFTDVSSSDYDYSAVLWAYENGITTGTSDTTFGPDISCTRGQAVTFLWRTKGEPTSLVVPAFADVDAEGYYSNAVAWAVEQGITTGTSETTFSPDGRCTRGQIVTFLWRACQSAAS
jgi:hypothetical protein